MGLSDFSLSQWLSDMGHSLKDNLPLAVVEMLFRQLGLDKFQRHPQCSITDEEFKKVVSGWSTGVFMRILLLFAFFL